MRISDWSSDVCSSDLIGVLVLLLLAQEIHQLVSRVCCWADHDRHEEAVAEHAFGRHPLIVFLIELRGEMRAERAAWIVAHAHPQHVRPDRKPLVMNIAPDPVEIGRAACREKRW